VCPIHAITALDALKGLKAKLTSLLGKKKKSAEEAKTEETPAETAPAEPTATEEAPAAPAGEYFLQIIQALPGMYYSWVDR
jgi:hypothetical protein